MTAENKQNLEKNVPFYPNKRTAIYLLLALICVHWFVVNILIYIDITLHHTSKLEKLLLGIKSAVFVEPHDSESIIITMIGMLFIPALLGIEYITSLITIRLWTHRTTEQISFPLFLCSLQYNWVWIIYWPLWTYFFAVCSFSWFTFISGICVVPTIIAIGIGLRIAKRYRHMLR